jgi:predicted NAD/FAD-binding protein
MNYLNKIDSKNTYIVSLNPISKPNKYQILYETYYEHPIFDINSTNTKNIINHNNGKSNVFFVGSYLGNGFHEDGVKSAQNAFDKFISVKR